MEGLSDFFYNLCFALSFCSFFFFASYHFFSWPFFPLSLSFALVLSVPISIVFRVTGEDRPLLLWSLPPFLTRSLYEYSHRPNLPLVSESVCVSHISTRLLVINALEHTWVGHISAGLSSPTIAPMCVFVGILTRLRVNNERVRMRSSGEWLRWSRTRATAMWSIHTTALSAKRVSVEPVTQALCH